MQADFSPPVPRRNWKEVVTSGLGMLAIFAFGNVLIHTLANGQYGFHRDELLTYNNARHLQWGYAVYPPVTAFFGRLSLVLFGTSLRGFRLFAAMAQGLAMLLTGLAAREMGGRREAQLVSAFAAALCGVSLVHGSFTSYTAFDFPCWILVAYFVIRLLKSDDPRWWLAIGATTGLGMMTKYTMAFLVLGVVGGVLLTPVRRHLKSPWLWLGAALALLVFLPNLLWQIHNHFVTLDCIRTIHARDVSRGSTDHFLLNQFWSTTNVVTVPIWCAGLWFLFVAPKGKRYRLLGWMYVIPLAAFLFAKGRNYYLAAAYPMLFAAGAVWGEQWLSSLSACSALVVRRIAWRTMAISGLCSIAVTLPIAP